jgi:PKD repeat protein
MFLYMHRIARTPYMTTYGPDAQNLTVGPNPVPQGTPVDLTALLLDHRYGGDPLAPVGAAEYFIDAPGADGTGFAMAPEDGSWGETSETAIATVDTSGLSVGRHYILVHGKKATTPNDYWGPVTAIVLDVLPGGPCDAVQIVDVITQTDGCSVSFAAELTGTAPFDYDWDFGAFGSSAEPTPTVAYGLPGTYAYTLTVSNCWGQEDDLYAGSVTVDCCVPPGDAAFAYVPSDPVSGETVVFTGTASGSDPLSYDWAFGDGAGASGAVVTHSYAAGGDYTVALTASNGCGAQSVTSTVSICQAVYGASYTWTPMTPTVGDLVSFHGLASGSAPIAYDWAFGDGTTGSGQDVTHTYGAPGAYTIVLTATNCGGYTSVIQGELTVEPPPCDAVADADFDWTPLAPVVGEWVTFHGSAAGTPPITYAWTFGDGGTGSGANVSHRYTAAGLFAVVMTAENCGGSTAVMTHTVAVVPAGCDVVEALSVTQEVAGCTVTFTAALSGTAPFTYSWAFGDGVTSTLAVPVHTYAATGTYSGTLDVWNCGGGGHDSLLFAVEVECIVPPEWHVYLPVVFK